MTSRLSGVLFGPAILFLTVAATPQIWGQARYDPYYRDNPYYGNRDPYYRQRYGYGQNQDYLIGRVISDLNQAASRAYLDEHERRHFDEVASSLQDFQSRWYRGKFDTGKLDKAIRNLEHLAEADRVRGRDRDMLARDLFDLRQFRDTRSGYYQRPGYYPR